MAELDIIKVPVAMVKCPKKNRLQPAEDCYGDDYGLKRPCAYYVKDAIIDGKIVCRFSITEKIAIKELCKNYIYRVVHMQHDIGIFEFGIGELRFDALLINARNRIVRGFEFKSCRGDFLSDKKWFSYLGWCNRFYFICPPDAISKKDIEEKSEGYGFMAGLIYVEPYAGDADRVNYNIIKRASNMPVPNDRYMQIMGTMLQKAKYRKDEIL